jgi:hypothetical protein
MSLAADEASLFKVLIGYRSSADARSESRQISTASAVPAASKRSLTVMAGFKSLIGRREHFSRSRLCRSNNR